MCASWVSGGAREYSLTNHTGPPVLWSRIRLAHRPNYSQSKPIKSNYDQSWIIRMPRRLIAQRDGAAGCHFQETVTLIVFFFFSLRSLTPSLSKTQCCIFSKDACWLQKDCTITGQSKNTNNTGLHLPFACLPICVLSSIASKLWRFPLKSGTLKWMTTSLQSAVTTASSRWFPLLLF